LNAVLPQRYSLGPGGLHSPTGTGLAGRRPNFTLETPQQAAGNVSVFKQTNALTIIRWLTDRNENANPGKWIR
jgi:hypothetical protein